MGHTAKDATIGSVAEGDDELRERIIEAADGLFYARGIQSVGIDAVREAAGVSLKRMYALIGSKEALVVAVLRHRQAIWRAGIDEARGGTGDARERLLSMFDFLDAWFGDPAFRGCGFINAFGEMGATVPAVSDLVREQKAGFRDDVVALVESAGGTREVGVQIALLAEGAQATAAILGPDGVVEAARAAAATLLDAATKPVESLGR